jgi:hypothetical protein
LPEKPLLPNSNSIRVPPVEQVVSSQEGRFSAQRWAKVPLDVIVDDRLSHRDVRVYSALCLCRRGAVVNVGVRWLAGLIHLRYQGVAESIQALRNAGHVDVGPRAPGKRASYRLTSALFVAGSPTAAAGSAAAFKPKPVPVACPNCRQLCRRLNATGQCRTCDNEVRLNRKIDSRITAALSAKAKAS